MRTYIGRRVNPYRSLLPRVLPLLIVLRYRTPSFPICLSEVAKRAPRLFASIPLIQRREKHRSREEKAPSRSGILLSMYVVLKTRHVNPNIHARRY